MELKGKLAQGILPGLLRELYVGRRSGVLRMEGDQAQRVVRFRSGDVARASSTVAAERLGETLVREGLLSQGDLDQAGELVRRDGLRLGRALQDLGAVDHATLERGMAAQAREVLLAAFASDGEYVFEELSGSDDEDADVALRVSTGQIILDAVRRLDDPDVVRYGLGDLDRPLHLTSDPLLRFQKIALDPTDGYVLSRVDGSLGARAIVSLTPLPPEDVLRSLLGLVATGLVEPRDAAAKRAPAAPAPASAPEPESPPAAAAFDAPVPAADSERRRELLELHASLQTRNHFEVLDVARDASQADIKAAYFRQARRFHPDVHHDPALADLRDKLEAVFIRVSQAYDVLKHEQSRRSYEARLPRESTAGARAPSAPEPAPAPASASAPAPTPAPDAAAQVDEALRKAERHFAAQQYWDAIRALETALPLAQGRALNRMRLLLAKALMKNPHWVRRAEETLQALIKDDPRHAEAHFLLGEIYKNGGLRARAAGMFRKVVELKPEHEEAAAQLAELAPASDSAPEAEKPGLLKKLFGRQ